MWCSRARVSPLSDDGVMPTSGLRSVHYCVALVLAHKRITQPCWLQVLRQVIRWKASGLLLRPAES